MAREPIRLAPKDKEVLLNLEADIRWLDEEIRKAETAGLDVASLKTDFEKSKKLRNGLLQQYG